MCVCVCVCVCVCKYVMCVCSIYLLLPQDKASHYVWPVYALSKYAINFLLFMNVATDTPTPPPPYLVR